MRFAALLVLAGFTLGGCVVAVDDEEALDDLAYESELDTLEVEVLPEPPEEDAPGTKKGPTRRWNNGSTKQEPVPDPWRETSSSSSAHDPN